MQLRHSNGTEVKVTGDKARRLLSSGSWIEVKRQSPIQPETPVEDVEVTPEGADTREDVQEPVEASEPQEDVPAVATIPEMREWARANGVQNVPAKGKLPRHAIEAYMNAHKE